MRLADHFGCLEKDAWGDREAERLRRLEVHDKLEPRRLLDG